jgi:hypothetical protein
MATALGLPVRSVKVGDAPRYDLADGPHQRLNLIRVLMAGGEAERVVFNHEPMGDGGDLEQIAELLEDGDDETAMRDGVRRLLELNSGTLRYLAARLARRGVLTGGEVEALVRGRTFPRAERPSVAARRTSVEAKNPR